ncbi:MAG: ATP-dependent helicase, partial [Candidatus Heimdallarchaeota archaeon]|nr:ATP-dependent helicase [Candidatus Heimdallarchaeota archaeon]
MKPSISYVDSSSKHSDMQEILHPVIIKWVLDTFGSFNEVQKLTIPQILANKSTLVMAPTGSGKTLAAFLGILSELIHYEEQDMLQDQIYALYISPLKALNNDIFKNLEIPLYDIKQISGTKIKSAKRTGDTTTQERQKISRNPPHILITTPESLGLMLAAPKFKEKLRTIKWLIVDEIHSVAENKRGTFLSVCLERLSYYLPSNLTRIGLSATVEPAELIAHYLIGNRDIELAFVDLGGSRELEIEVISPVKNLVQAHYNQIEKGHIDYIKKSLQKHETTLIFSNTRYLSERLSYKLQNIQDYQYRDKIAVHHGSLDKDVRMEVEDKLKKGDMKAVFTSTSLEMGIDIGSIDLTIQLGSPKSVRAMLQRIGRSGHQENLISKGKILVFNRDDLLECVAIAKLTVEGKIDAIEIPEKPIDVLIQMIVGMAVEKRWKIDEAYQLIRLSYSYRNLSKEEFIQILKFAAVPTEDDEIAWRYAHIWLDIENGEFGKRKSARQAYLQNIGTIPDETTIDVLLEGYRNKIGKVSEKFAEKLKTSDIFILGGKSLQFIRTISDKILVRDAPGMIPTIPSWGGERMPRSNEISMEIQLLLTKLETFIVSNKKLDAVSWLIKEYPINKEIANLIYDYGNEQFSLTHLPKLNSIVIETYVEPSGFKNILVLTLFGLKINMTLSQLLATLHSQDMDVNVGVIATDNGFLLRLPPQTTFETSRLFEILENNDLKQILTQSVLDSEIFKNRFRHVVSRSLMILRNWGGGNVSVIQQKKKSYWLQKHLKIDSPIVKEVQDEVFFDMYDLVQTNVIVNKIVNKQIEVSLYPEYDLPSPMTHDILLNHNVDVVTISDKSSLLMNLHHQVLSRLMPNIQIHNVFDRGEISDYFQNKIQKKNSIEEVLLEFSKYPKYLEHLDIEFSRITNLSTDKLDFIKDKSVFLFTDGTYKSIDLLPFYGSISPMEFW